MRSRWGLVGVSLFMREAVDVRAELGLSRSRRRVRTGLHEEEDDDDELRQSDEDGQDLDDDLLHGCACRPQGGARVTVWQLKRVDIRQGDDADEGCVEGERDERVVTITIGVRAR